MGILNSAPENPSPYISVTIDDGLPSVGARSGEPLARSQGPADHAIPMAHTVTVCIYITHQSGRDLERHKVGFVRWVASETSDRLIRVVSVIQHQSLHRGISPDGMPPPTYYSPLIPYPTYPPGF